MSIEGLEHFSKDQLIEELINRQTFAGVVIFHRGDVKAGRLEPGEVVMTKSPPLTRADVEHCLRLGQSLVGPMFGVQEIAQGEADALRLHTDVPPLSLHEGGVVRIGNSRISLDLVVEQYQNGVSAEEMVRAYDTLELADLYAALAYYLRHREQVETYLKRRREEAQAQQASIEAGRPSISRQELLARRAAIEQEHAPTGH